MPDNKLDHSLLMETAIDIALNAGRLITEGKIAVSDSRELVQNIKTMARTFEQSGYDRDDYIGAVDAFSEERLLHDYGTPSHMQTIRLSNEIYLIYTCNEWKEHSSMSLVAATAERDTLYSIMADEILKGHMGYVGETGKVGIVRLREDYKDGHIDPGKLDYGFVQETKVECYLSPDSSMRYYQLHELLDMDNEEFARHFPIPSDDEADMEYYEDESEPDNGLEP